MHIAARLRGGSALLLSCCSKALRLAALATHAWEQRLQSELGFTAAGVARWQEGCRSPTVDGLGLGVGPALALVDCYLYVTEKHEAVEVEALRQVRVRVSVSVSVSVRVRVRVRVRARIRVRKG